MNHTPEMVVSVAAGTEGDDTAEERDDCGRGEELTGAIPRYGYRQRSVR